VNIKAQTKLLVKESFDASGKIDGSRVSAVCDFIENEQSPDKQIRMLKSYMRALEPLISKETVLVECSGDIDEATMKQITEFVQTQTNRKNLLFEKSINKSLLGGIRITCGDDIWESSTSQTLGNILQ